MQTFHIRGLQQALMAALAWSAGAVLAQPAGGQAGLRQPPKEALAACSNLSAGQDCSFTAPEGVVAGTCQAPKGKPLACKPKDAPEEPRPPKQP